MNQKPRIDKFGLKVFYLSNCCNEPIMTGITETKCSKCLKEIGRRVGKLYYKISHT